MVQLATYQSRECLWRKVLDEIEESGCVAVTRGLVACLCSSPMLVECSKGGKRFFAEKSPFIARKRPHIKLGSLSEAAVATWTALSEVRKIFGSPK